MTSRVIFSGFVIVLVGLGFSASVNPPRSDLVNVLHKAIQDWDPFAVQLASEIDDDCIGGRYHFTISIDERGHWNEWDESCRLLTSTLGLALFYNQETVALNLIAKGADIFETDQFGNTPLHLAAARGLENVVSKFMGIINDIEIMDQVKMSKQQAIDLKNFHGKTPLHLAIHYMREVVIKNLLAEGATSMVADHEGNTALHLSAAGTGETFIDLIKAAKPKPNELMRQSGMPPRLYTRLIKRLIDAGLPEDLISVIFIGACETLNLKNEQGRTALSYAVLYRRVDIAHILFENGADPTIGSGDKPLSFHVRSSLTDENLLSIIQNIDVNHQYHDGSTILHCAVKGRRDVVVESLLDKGADPTIADKHGNTALHLAVKKFLSNKTIIQIIKAARRNTVDVVGHNEMTNPCGRLDHHDLDRQVICPAKPNIFNLQNHDGQTTFFLAVYFARAEIAQILLKNGADPTITDNDGNTALHLAMKEERSGWTIIEMFMAAMTKTVNTDGDDCDYLLHLANGRSRNELVELLSIRGADPLALHWASKDVLFSSVLREMITPLRFRCVMKNEGQTPVEKFRRSLIRTFRKMRHFFRVSCSLIVNIQNHKEETALSLAVSDQRLAVVEILLKLGADRTIKTNGQTTLELAVQMETEHKNRFAAEIVKLLSICNTTTYWF